MESLLFSYKRPYTCRRYFRDRNVGKRPFAKFIELNYSKQEKTTLAGICFNALILVFAQEK